MDYNIQIQCCALVFLILFAAEFFARKRENNRSTKAFKYFIIFAFFLAVDDIICPIALSTPGCPDGIRVVTGKLYLIFMYYCLISLFAFTISLTIEGTDKKEKKIRLLKICPYIGAVLTVVTLVLPLYYVSEQTYVYTYGPCSKVCYVVGALMGIMIPLYLFFNRKTVPMSQKIPIYTYILIGVICTAIENAEPRLLLTTFGVVIDIGLILFTLKNPYVRELEDKNNSINEMYNKIIKALVNSVDAKDRYTRGHSQRVAEYSVKIAKKMGKNEAEQQEIYTAGLLHDIGKIRVPEAIINKPGKLTDEEYSKIKVHPVSGSHILSHIFNDSDIIFGAKYHHERYDGKGYPNGLSGSSIPEIARIVGIADAYDAMTSNRSYRDYLPQTVVRGEIVKGRGVQFDPDIADVMLELMDEDGAYKMREKNPKIKVILVTSSLEDANFVREAFDGNANYEILFEKNLKEVFNIIDTGDISLVIADPFFEEGAEMIDEISMRFDTPIIAMTENKKAISSKFSGNVEDYLCKPVNPVILRESVHSIIYFK